MATQPLAVMFRELEQSFMLVTETDLPIIISKNNHYIGPVHTKSKSAKLPADTIIGQVLCIDEELQDTLLEPLCESIPETKLQLKPLIKIKPLFKIELWKPFTTEQLPISPSLTIEQKLQLLDIINENYHAFATSIQELGCIDLVTMEINNIPGSTPCAQKPYYTLIEFAHIFDEKVDKWHKYRIVETSISSYVASALLVNQKYGSKRPVINY